VHFAYIGHPLTGDDLYGTPSDAIARHALHALTLAFPHPVTNEVLKITAPLADDFEAALRKFFPSYAERNPL
jgi:23S rRNA pseudouridine1911/1915/1917 synthase